MSTDIYREYTTIEVTALREPERLSRTEVFEIHTKDIGLTIGVTVIWYSFRHHFLPGTSHADRAVAIAKRIICEALDEAVDEHGRMTNATFNSCFRSVRERNECRPWDGVTVRDPGSPEDWERGFN